MDRRVHQPKIRTPEQTYSLKMATPLGLTYNIPQQFLQPQQFGAAQAPTPVQSQNILPENPQNLADTMDGLTQQYLTIGGTIDAFARDMARRGIDVFAPDISQPGGGQPFQTMQQLKAALLYAANNLQNKQREREILLPFQARGDIMSLPGAQETSGYQPFNERFVNTGLDPQVQQVNQQLSRDFLTAADAARANQQIAEPLRQYYRDLIRDDPANAPYYQRQLAAIGTAVHRTPASAFNPPRSTGKTFEGEFLRRVTNLSQGAWPEGSYQVGTYKGNPVLINKTFAGERMGEAEVVQNGKVVKKDRIIKQWIKTPNGQVIIEFVDPNIPPVTVSGVAGDAVAAQIMSSNPKYGDVGKMYEAARQQGFMDFGGVRNEVFTPGNIEELNQQQQAALSAYSAQISQGRQQVLQTLQELASQSNPWIGNRTITITLPDGRTLKIGKHRSGGTFYIDNAGEFFGQPVENQTAEGIIAILDSLGYFQQFLQAPVAPAEGNVPLNEAPGDTLRNPQVQPPAAVRQTQPFDPRIP